MEIICKCKEIKNKGHKHCPDKIKGFDLCKKKKELKCFKHCSPISQPCDEIFYNQFTSRADMDFSGLIVVVNSGNITNGCSMEVQVTDSAGTSTVAVINPGASVPIFTDSLISLDIKCFKNESENPLPGTCSGEIKYDLEYYLERESNKPF
ncbi:hypothetical protein P8610_09920 [Fictibacillus sp. UD]|uniref:S-Ena type endospore appendage n=1 Tax=Fictibacillus sp. UD TaxID=3038777 RepID=UPI003744D13A